MSWIETIKICMGRGSQGGAGILKTLECELAAVPDLNWSIYRHLSVPGDAMIVLRWQKNSPTYLKSNLAASLIRELKRHGLVDYDAWINMEKQHGDREVTG